MTNDQIPLAAFKDTARPGPGPECPRCCDRGVVLATGRDHYRVCPQCHGNTPAARMFYGR